jgi:RHS repeat-associated protein
VARIKYFISGALQYSQTFQYDQVNRLRYAVEHNNGVYNDVARAWYQTFDYDLHGNRGINVANTTDNADASNSALQLADFSGANNRITRADFVYDVAGNLIAEPGKIYTYDAQNRIVTAIVAGGVTSQYVYDGNGRRVKKIVGGVATRFEYGAGGELITERRDSDSNVIKDYFYKGGALLATSKIGNSGEYEYATSDHLGSPRAWTGPDGNLIAGGRHDYCPFGEELFAGVGIRSAPLSYGADSTRQKFTGKERDAETGLDYFHARYYSNIQGRFTSVDPENAGAIEDDPQSWNGYAYARNAPVVYSDPDGRKYRICSTDGECYDHSDDDFNAGRRAGKKDGFTFTGDGKYYEKGEIRDKDGNVIATYEQTSLDDPAHQLAFEMQRNFGSPDFYKRVAANLVSSAILAHSFRARGSTIHGNWVTTTSPSRSAALRDAKLANDIPLSRGPDRIINPNTDGGRAARLRPGDNVRLYEYTNSSGQKIWIREDKAASYGAPGGRGDQGPHFNSGPAGDQKNLNNHHYWSQ